MCVTPVHVRQTTPICTAGTHALPIATSAENESNHTVVSGHPHGLCTVPAREGVGRETRVDEGEVSAVEDMVEVVVVVVHLRGRELTLVDNVLGRERADVEALGERTSGEKSPGP